MATVNLTVGIQAVTGPQMSVTSSLDGLSYDKVDYTLQPGGSSAPEVVVELQPSSADKIAFLAIKSSVVGKDITYKANDGTADSTITLELDQPLVLLGNSVKLLGVAPKVLKFTNKYPVGDASKKAVLEIFVGRQAVTGAATGSGAGSGTGTGTGGTGTGTGGTGTGTGGGSGTGGTGAGTGSGGSTGTGGSSGTGGTGTGTGGGSGGSSGSGGSGTGGGSGGSSGSGGSGTGSGTGSGGSGSGPGP